MGFDPCAHPCKKSCFSSLFGSHPPDYKDRLGFCKKSFLFALPTPLFHVVLYDLVIVPKIHYCPRLMFVPSLFHLYAKQCNEKYQSIRIGPDRAYPLHFTLPQLLQLLPFLFCIWALSFEIIKLQPLIILAFCTIKKTSEFFKLVEEAKLEMGLKLSPFVSANS